MSDARLLEAVRDVAKIAGDVALRRYEKGVAVETKADGSDVSVADREAEQAARDWIGANFPDDGIVGEELGELRPHAARRWIVDPIDGTASFVRRVPLWGTLVAVARGDTVLAGAIYCPAVNEMVHAARGQGCWWNGRRAQVSAVDRMDRATVLTSTERFPAAARQRERGWRALAAGARLARGWGDCFGYLLVATGRAEVMVDPALAAWDSAALQPVIEEAGGAFTDWSGRATAFGGSAVATNAALALEVRARLVVAS